MLAKNFHYNTAKIVPSFQGRPFCMDVKLDGERMLCHKEGDKVMIGSWHIWNMSTVFPDESPLSPVPVPVPAYPA